MLIRMITVTIKREDNFIKSIHCVGHAKKEYVCGAFSMLIKCFNKLLESSKAQYSYEFPIEGEVYFEFDIDDNKDLEYGLYNRYVDALSFFETMIRSIKNNYEDEINIIDK